MKNEDEVIAGVKSIAIWWFSQRRKKLVEQLNETMSINPFLMPFLCDYHDLDGLDELAELIVASHLMTGHNTGFGKLVDEKILPNVFGAKKLDKKFRESNQPFSESCFDEIDHIITRRNGKVELLSLKAGKWTIQLTMSVQLNGAFHEILTKHPRTVSDIVVGVFYGDRSSLTDKYDILRGINRGANHDVVDLTDRVFVYAGREFWAWLNDGQEQTQEWVMRGITAALDEEKINETSSKLLAQFKKGVVEKYHKDVVRNGELDWELLLKKING
ncbi:restriction endonuclease [Solemya pervernicosa gill symbiont]|uniref:Restriction endonuclease n=1 Tax=Solemya pervernicosa gill symbiont TaxID=642797 RepID=A0A1T2L8F3_9GAMM|nr:restriction endonuclease [Solemya pervernicosa gill symbiont]OOZ41322.1 restriction endonuclease [Solemya pervernicosa gill symbiont]